MRVNTNMAALVSQNALGRASNRADNSMRKLSTGLRINSAADDAAGMAISNKLRTQVNGLRMASRNSLDGISLVQTAEGALAEVQNMVQRMRELAIQAANDTLQAEDRQAIQREVDQLITEINDTAIKTEFNTIRLLNGDSDRATASSHSSVATTSFISDTLEPGNITYDLIKPGLPAAITSSGPAQGGGLVGFMNDNPGVSMAGMFTINGETIEITENDTPITIANKLRELAERVGVDLHVTPFIGSEPNDPPPPATWEQWLNGDATLLLATQSAGSNQHLSISSDNSALLRALGLPNTSQNPPRGTDAVVENVVYNGLAVLAASNGNEISITAGAGQNIRINIHTQIDLNVPGGALQLGDGTTNALNFKNLDFARGNFEKFFTALNDAEMGLTSAINAVNNVVAVNPLTFGAAYTAINGHIGNLDTALTGAIAGINTVLNLNPPDEVTDFTEALAEIDAAIAARIAAAYINSDPNLQIDLDQAVTDAQNARTALMTAQNNLTNAGNLRTNLLDAEATRAYAAAIVGVMSDAFPANSPFIGDPQAVLDSIGTNLGSEADPGLALRMDILDFGPLILHVGPNRGTTLTVQLPALNAKGLGLENVNMRSRQGADRAIAQMDEALSRVSEIRSRLGAYQNRLEYTIANLNTTQENATASLSRIEDVDMAMEMSRFTQLNVLTQAGVSILAQANQRPQQILSLLQ